ncbi:hypothetical protein RJ639_025666, partial [Escallonia herrerae]
MAQNQKSPGNSDAYANAAGLGYEEDDWLGRDVKFSETIFPFMSATHPTSTFPHFSPDFMDNWQSSPSLPTNIPYFQPQPTEPATIQESISSIQSPLAKPTAVEDISLNPTQPITSSPPAQTTEPISTSSDSIIPSSPPLRQFLRPKQPPAWHRDYILSTQVNPPSTMPCSTPSHTKPQSYAQAILDLHWQQVMNVELEALQQNKTWSLVQLPDGHKPIGCKWVYKTKYRSDGTIERYKARLVAKGYTQVEGIDYQETFSPTAKLTTLRCLLTIISARHWFAYQLDVQNAFLHGDLQEEVYMEPPPGLRRQGENIVINNQRLIILFSPKLKVLDRKAEILQPKDVPLAPVTLIDGHDKVLHRGPLQLPGHGITMYFAGGVLQYQRKNAKNYETFLSPPVYCHRMDQ